MSKQCFKISKKQPSSNYTATSGKDFTWLLDSGSTNHVTSDMNKKKIHDEHEETNALTIGNGSNLSISHIGYAYLSSLDKSFKFDNILCVLQITKI